MEIKGYLNKETYNYNMTKISIFTGFLAHQVKNRATGSSAHQALNSWLSGLVQYWLKVQYLVKFP